MSIKYYYCTEYDKDFDAFYPYNNKSDRKKDKTNFYSIHYLLKSDFLYVFDKIGRLKLSELHDPETLYEISTQTMTCGFDPKTKTIHIIFEMDIVDYNDKHWALDEDFSATQLAIQGKIPSTTLSEENFIELLYNWQKINLLEPPFALIWQDENDWIYAKAFGCEEDMDAFIKEHYKDDAS